MELHRLSRKERKMIRHQNPGSGEQILLLFVHFNMITDWVFPDSARSFSFFFLSSRICLLVEIRESDRVIS